jgi:hypothetical protein
MAKSFEGLVYGEILKVLRTAGIRDVRLFTGQAWQDGFTVSNVTVLVELPTLQFDNMAGTGGKLAMAGQLNLHVYLATKGSLNIPGPDPLNDPILQNTLDRFADLQKIKTVMEGLVREDVQDNGYMGAFGALHLTSQLQDQGATEQLGLPVVVLTYTGRFLDASAVYERAYDDIDTTTNFSIAGGVLYE